MDWLEILAAAVALGLILQPLGAVGCALDTAGLLKPCRLLRLEYAGAFDKLATEHVTHIAAQFDVVHMNTAESLGAGEMPQSVGYDAENKVTGPALEQALAMSSLNEAVSCMCTATLTIQGAWGQKKEIQVSGATDAPTLNETLVFELKYGAWPKPQYEPAQFKVVFKDS